MIQFPSFKGPKHQPSDMIDAPDSLNMRDPIWIGKTFSAGRIAETGGFDDGDDPSRAPGPGCDDMVI